MREGTSSLSKEVKIPTVSSTQKYEEKFRKQPGYQYEQLSSQYGPKVKTEAGEEDGRSEIRE